ncbi:MAG: UDP-N-acetylmuramate:L-alanyl-gamma-D-glutamyl-meso-diaminopimelate ligase [Burkholderiales bacterium]|nr:UDP-N-acetylmuramate:L-alanyl-gamma-D-glutamyl-meso-diaminopimelate ligase [Burkholderiales bacterium]
MHIHILGICGTFMGGIAAIAKQAGHTVTGCDANVYPPMSTQLEALGITLHQGFDAEQLNNFKADMYVVGNAMTRGRPVIEEILNRGLPYTSGPQWLAENVLRDKWVLAVAGTHGKTTTTSILAWLLEQGGLNPGFLIGGVPLDFGVSARLTDSPFFVVEADEYDTAFFDKRSKFVWYRPRTAILNNLEYDHADIFPDIEAIERQFHHLVRTVPGNGLLVVNGTEQALGRVLSKGCWSGVEAFGPGHMWDFKRGAEEGQFEVLLNGVPKGIVSWRQSGAHNMMNALAAVAAARHAGVPVKSAVEALSDFGGVKRRMEVRGEARGVTVYDDFAHHPTAIRETIAGLRRKLAAFKTPQRIFAVLEPRSNTMKMGAVRDALAPSLSGADFTFCYARNLGWDVAGALSPLGAKAAVFEDVEVLITAMKPMLQPGDHVLVMSNGGFDNIHQRLLDALR